MGILDLKDVPPPFEQNDGKSDQGDRDQGGPDEQTDPVEWSDEAGADELQHHHRGAGDENGGEMDETVAGSQVAGGCGQDSSSMVRLPKSTGKLSNRAASHRSRGTATAHPA